MTNMRDKSRFLFNVELMQIDDTEQDPYSFKTFPVVEKNQTDNRTYHHHIWKLNPNEKLPDSVVIEVFQQFWVGEQINKDSLGRYTLAFE